MSNRKKSIVSTVAAAPRKGRKPASPVKTDTRPKLGTLTPTSSQPTPAQKDAILDRADKPVPVVTKRKRGRPAKSIQAAPQAAPAVSNGKHPQTIAAVASTSSALSMVITDHYSNEVPNLDEALKTYRRLKSGADGEKIPEARLYMNGTQVYVIKQNGNAYDLNDNLLAREPSAEESKQPEQIELEPATAVTIPGKYIAAALAIAPKKDTRYYLNGVYIHQVGSTLRVVATDGHRMLVISTECIKFLPWGVDGVILPREELARISSYIGKGEGTALQLSFGRQHPVAKLSEDNGMAQFVVTPVDGKFPDYMKVVESAGDVLTSERSPMDTAALSSAYLKSAGAIAAQLESESVFPFVGSSPSDPCMFTFANEPGAILYIMGQRSDKPAIQAPVVKMLGDVGMARSLAALKAHETRCRKAAKDAGGEAEARLHKDKADAFQARADEIRAMLSVKLTGPTEVKADESTTQEESAEA